MFNAAYEKSLFVPRSIRDNTRKQGEDQEEVLNVKPGGFVEQSIGFKRLNKVGHEIGLFSST
jgi:hypothetical protein